MYNEPLRRKGKFLVSQGDKYKKFAAGFTLVEMAVVLVIIALIISAAIMGADLIHNAKINKIISQISSYNAARNTFQGKYGGIPGDLEKAVVFGLGTSGGPGDNGNGDQYLTNTTTNAENINFWYHLGRAGYIDGSFDGVSTDYGVGAPKTSLDGVGVYAGTITVTGMKNVYIIGLSDSFSDIYTLTPLEAYHIDYKMDDEDPLTGRARAPEDFDGDTTAGFDPLCYSTASVAVGEYNVNADAPWCVLFLEFN